MTLSPFGGGLGADNIGLKGCSYSHTDVLCLLSKINRQLEDFTIPICHPQLFGQIPEEPGMLKDFLNCDALGRAWGEDAPDQVFAFLRDGWVLWNPAKSSKMSKTIYIYANRVSFHNICCA